MRTILKALLLLLSMGIVHPPCALAVDVPDGLYVVGPGPPTATVSDGRTVTLGRKLADDPGIATIISVSNDNSQFQLRLERPTPFLVDHDSVALSVAGRTMRFNSYGTGGGTFTYSGTFKGDDTARIFGAFLKTTPRLRTHPGQLFLVRFRPSKPRSSAGEAFVVALELKNVGSRTVSFLVGGRNRGARDNQFGFTASDGVHIIPDTGNPTHFGGLGYFQTLKPGEVFTKEVDLAKWFRFERPGTYQVVGSYYLAFRDPVEQGHFMIWEDYATAEFLVGVEAPAAGGASPGLDPPRSGPTSGN